MQNNPFGDERAGGRRLRLKPYAPPARKVSTWQTALGVAGLASGLVSILFGTAFAALGWLSALPEKESYLRSLGTVLLVASIPLLILGAHFLDLSDQRRASRRRPARASSEAGVEKIDGGGTGRAALLIVAQSDRLRRLLARQRGRDEGQPLRLRRTRNQLQLTEGT